VEWGVVGYEFYLLGSKEVFHSIGILPERRKNPERITQQSIINWGRMILRDDADPSKLSFSRIIINQKTGEISYYKPSVRDNAEA